MIMTVTVNHHHKLTHPYPLFCSPAAIHRINVREVVCGPNLVVEIIIFIVKKKNNSILIPFYTNLAVKTTIVLIINNNNIFLILFMDTNSAHQNHQQQIHCKEWKAKSKMSILALTVNVCPSAEYWRPVIAGSATWKVVIIFCWSIFCHTSDLNRTWYTMVKTVEIRNDNHQSLQIGHHLFTGSWGTSFIVVSGEKVPTILQKNLVLVVRFLFRQIIQIIQWRFHQIIQTFFQCEVRSSSTEHLFAAKIWKRSLDSPKNWGVCKCKEFGER